MSCCDTSGNCNENQQEKVQQECEISKQFDIPEKFKDAIDVLGDKQVLKLITKKGSDSAERASAGCTAILHYTGTLTNGNKFDSSRDRGEPFETPVGQGRVIRGWDAVMPTMAKGERAEVLIQSDCAYGPNGSPPSIPGGAALIFDMEMIDWFGEDISSSKNKSLTKIKLVDSEKFVTIDGEDLDEITISLKINGEIISEKLSWIVGEESLEENSAIDEAVSASIKSMAVGEKAVFTAKKFSDYNKTGDDKKYEIEILDNKAAKRSYDMKPEEMLEIGETVKAKGTELLKAGKLEVAHKKYDYVVKLLADQDGDEAKALSLSCMSNCCLIANKLKNYYAAVTLCDNVLEKDPNNEKALYRKGEALYALKEFQQAQKVFKQVLDINPDNKLAKKNFNNSQKQYKAWQEAEKKKYSKMFG